MPAREHRLEGEHVGSHLPVAGRRRPRGIRGGHPAQRRVGAGVDREPEAVRAGRRLELRPRDAGLHRHGEIVGAKGILLSIAGGEDLTLQEVNAAAEEIRGAATEETNIIFGATIDPRLTGQVWVTVVATGIGKMSRRPTPRAAMQPGRSEDPLEPPSFLRDL